MRPATLRLPTPWSARGELNHPAFGTLQPDALTLSYQRIGLTLMVVSQLLGRFCESSQLLDSWLVC